MPDNLEIWVKISQQIGELNSSVKATLDKLTEHEHRITSLEREKAVGEGNFKNTVIQLLVKGIVASVFVIGSLSGAGALLKGIFGM